MTDKRSSRAKQKRNKDEHKMVLLANRNFDLTNRLAMDWTECGTDTVSKRRETMMEDLNNEVAIRSGDNNWITVSTFL